MEVVNKNNKVVPFDEEKVRHSILSAAMDADFSLTTGDLDALVTDVKNVLDVTTDDCRAAEREELIKSVCKVLSLNGFSKVKHAYKHRHH
ncbi:ATP cone domain-containing protein [Clostridium sp. Ade.TY]|uniref:ATP cone domain-containing protein n=1 Tax=Clostridium sp. Ade.TY TaxID=1391647 RepID=UPI0003F554A3|nr:ATP cone domain-containing protein [Clostridium sp. Ade.TY]